MDVLIKNADVVIYDGKHSGRNRDIWISGNRIRKVGAGIKVPGKCKTIDAAGKVVMPGLVNGHTHLYQTFLKGIRDDLELKSWCETILFPFADLVHKYHWDKEDIEAGYFWSSLGSIEMIHSGVTCCINMDLTLDSVFQAWRDIGFRGIGAITAVNRWIPKEFIRSEDERKGEIKAYIHKWNEDTRDGGLIKVFMAPSTIFACTDDFLTWLIDTAEEYDLGVHTHLSETRWEVEQSLSEFNMTPLKYLESLQFLRRTVSAAHCVHLTDEEIHLAAEKGLIPVYNPKSNMKLGSGIAPVVRMKEMGIRVALATDGPASNDRLNMLEEMRTGLLLQKVAHENPGVLSAGDIFTMATENGAVAAGIDAGVIREGKLADIVILDLCKAHSNPVHDVIQDIVYCADSSNVTASIINGKVIMENGRIVTVDEDALVEEAAAVAVRKFGSLDFRTPIPAEF